MNKVDTSSPEEMTDRMLEQLLCELYTGNKEVFGCLASYYQPKLKAMARIFLHSEYDVEDVVQESLIRAYNALDKFRGEAKLSTWLCRIVINQAKNHIQQKYRKYEVLWDDNKEMQAIFEEDGDGGSAEKYLQETVLYEINQLPEKLRKTLLLRLSGLKYSEISEKLNCSIGTVKSQLARARSKLKNKLIP